MEDGSGVGVAEGGLAGVEGSADSLGALPFLSGC